MKWFHVSRMILVWVAVTAAVLLGFGGRAKADFTFGTPKNLGLTVNSPKYVATDASPCISADGLELYFASRREGGYGSNDIWVCIRKTTEDQWGEPNNPGEIVNSPLSEFQPAVSSDGLELYIEVWEPAPSGSSYVSGGIFVTKRATRNDPWGERLMLDLTVPSGYLAGTPSISADGLELYISAGRFDDEPRAEIYVTKRETTEAPWGEPTSLGPVVNNWTCQVNPRISSDGLLLIFSDWWAGSPRPEGLGDSDLWFTRRATKDSDWCEPVNLGPAINTSFHECGPAISADGSTLYFASRRFNTIFWGVNRHGLYQAPVLPVVDFDGDGLVAINDLLKLIESIGTDDSQCDIGPMPWGDGVVDTADVEAFMKYWGQDMTGIVAHWKLDEVEGIVAYDSAGANDAILVGDPVWQLADGMVDGALELDGIDDGAKAGFVLDPHDSPCSAFAWIKGGGPGQVIISQAKGDIGRGVNWLLTDSVGNLISEFKPVYPPEADVNLVSWTKINDGQWHHVGFVWDFLGTRILYVDGIEVARDTIKDWIDTQNGGINIGFRASILHRPEFWSGLIDDVRIYDVALTPEVIEALMQ